MASSISRPAERSTASDNIAVGIIAVGIIAAGGLAIASIPLWSATKPS